MNGEILHLVNLSLELFASYLITNSVSLIVIVFFKWFISCWVIYGSLWFLRKWFISSKWSKLIYSCLQYFVIFLLRAVGSVVIYSLLFLMLVICVVFLSCLKFTILLSFQRTNFFFFIDFLYLETFLYLNFVNFCSDFIIVSFACFGFIEVLKVEA